MQRCSIMELCRTAKMNNADIFIAQETGIENSESKEIEEYMIWTSSDNEAKKNKDEYNKKQKEEKGRGRGKGKRPRDANGNSLK